MHSGSPPRSCACCSAISKGAAWGWTSGTTLGLFAAGIVILLIWGAYQLRTSYALVDLRVAARKQVLFTNLASMSFGFSMFAMSLVLPQLLQLPEATGYGLGQSLLVSGLVLTPAGAGHDGDGSLLGLVSPELRGRRRP